MTAGPTTRDQKASMRVLRNRAESWNTRTGSTSNDSQMLQQATQGGHDPHASSSNGNADLRADRQRHVSCGMPNGRESERILRIMSLQE